MSEAGKVALIAAVITTVGGGLFGITNSLITVLGSDSPGDKPGEGAPKQTAQGDPPSDRSTSDSEPDSSTDVRCSDLAEGWESKKEIGRTDDFDPRKQEVRFANVELNERDGGPEEGQRDDYLVVDRETGAVKAWLNNGEENGKFRWAPPLGVPMTSGTDLKKEEHVDFADLNGDDYDDYLVVNNKTGEVRAWKFGAREKHDGTARLGRPDWTIDARLPNGTTDARIEFADLDGDGRDDYLVIDADSGAVHARLNSDSGDSGQPDWKRAERVLPAGQGNGDSSVFHNVNCDKRADHLLSTDSGPMRAQLNAGPKNGNFAWEDEYQFSFGARPGYHTPHRDFADLNGDGRTDVVWVNKETGAAMPHINQGGDSRKAPSANVTKQ